MMKQFILVLSLFFLTACTALACPDCPIYKNSDFQIRSAHIKHHADLEISIWEIEVEGKAGATTPKAKGQLDGAPVLGYVFPTSLKAEDVGFGKTEGILALALTSHPDFDDTPLWDENSDQIFDNDGLIWHPHWVVLQEDKRVKGGFSVKQFDPNKEKVLLPPTNPGMPMYMDSPGFPVTTTENKIRVLIPDYRINGKTDFRFDALSCFLQVNTSKSELPMLGVYEVYGIASEDLSLPYKVQKESK